MLETITPLILTFNEEPNIRRVLEKLTWAGEVVVLDSGSTDRTREIALSFPNVRWETRPFDNFANQCNYALDNLLPKADWILSLDSDYVLGPDCEKELGALSPEPGSQGFEFGFTYCVEGMPLRGTLYPPRVCLFHSGAKAKYIQEGHAHRLVLEGKVVPLASRILHDDRKPLSRWLVSQAKYADQEADLILSQPWKKLRFSNKVRKWILFSPVLAPLVYLFLRGGIFDGKPGLIYAFQRLMAEAIISIKLLERKISQ